MKFLPLASAFAVALLTAGAANAATTTPPPAQTTQTPAKPGAAVDPDEMKALGRTNLAQEMRAKLAKAGFTAIKIVPSSFYVHAMNKKGEPVAMVIGPDTFTEVTEIKTQASTDMPKSAPGPKSAPSSAPQSSSSKM